MRLKGLRLDCARLESGPRQLDLFTAAPAAPAAPPVAATLQQALDRLRERYGMGALRWGRSLEGP